MNLSRLLPIAHMVAAFVILISIAAWLSPKVASVPLTPGAERFDESLSHLVTVEALLAEADKRSRSKATLDRVFALEAVIDDRFYHGYSVYTLNENWVAWLAAKLVHPHIARKVLAHEVLEHPWAACSQQAMVVQRALRKMGIPYGVAEFPQHFAATAFIGGKWYLVDPWGLLKRDRSRLYTLEEWSTQKGREAILVPEGRQFGEALNFEAVRLTRVNSFPAPTMGWFHPLSQFLSNWLFVPAIAWLLACLWRLSLRTRSRAAAQARAIGSSSRPQRDTPVVCRVLGHQRCPRSARSTDGIWTSVCVRCRSPLMRLAPKTWIAANAGSTRSATK